MRTKKIIGLLKVLGVFKSTASEEILAEEAERFARRNAIVVDCMDDVAKIHCCEKCLAAHLITFGRKRRIFRNRLQSLDERVGHEGYYIDDNELVKYGKGI